MHIDSLLMGRALAFVAMSVVLGLASPARAGGGARIVDDDATPPSGVCHVERWLMLSEETDDFAVAAPACSLAALPRLEIAMDMQRTWGTDEVTKIAPALKLNLRVFEDAPVGVAISATALWSSAERRVESYTVTLPVSARLDERLVVHANLGWTGQSQGDDRPALFWGRRPNMPCTRT